MTNSPIISVIIPFFNVENYFEQCLASVYKASPHLIEVVLVNDGSTDSSGEIAERYNSEYPDRTVLINKDFEGVSVARNVGLKHATGEWIAFLDSDDFIDFDAFGKIIEYALSTKSDIITFDGFRFVQETNSILPLYSQRNPYAQSDVINSREYLTTFINMSMTNIVTIWDKIYRKSTLHHLGIEFVKDLLHQDVQFTFDVFLSELKVECVPEKVVYYRQRSGSITYTESPQKVESKVFLVDYLLNLYKEKNLDEPAFNDYAVFVAKKAIRDGGRIRTSTLNSLYMKNLSFKKRLTLLTLYLFNNKI